MDLADKKLLHAIQHDATRTTDELAELLGMSSSSVQRRLKHLRDRGVIQTQVAIVDPRKVGQALTLVVGLEIEQKRPDLYGQLMQWFASNSAIQQAYNVTGATDFVLIVSAPSLEAYDALMNRMMADNSNVKKYITSVVLQTFKRTLFTPVETEPD